MDCDDFRAILRDSGVDLWSFIDTAISVAGADFGDELMARRDGIVAKLYATTLARCRNCDLDNRRPAADEALGKRPRSDHGPESDSPSPPRTAVAKNQEDRDDDDDADQEQTRILAIREHLEDIDQSEDSLVSLLQNLVDMDITFKALQETDIGRYVNRLRKHSSSEVRRLVKLLVRNWKDLVDEWVKSNTPGDNSASAIIADGDSPQRMPAKSNHHGNQVPDFGCSPKIHHNGIGSCVSEKQNPEADSKGKGVSRRELPVNKREVAAAKREMPVSNPTASSTVSANKQKESNESVIDLNKLASARKRLHENYQEAQNAKKQRTIQKLDLHDIPKPKNSFFPRNKSGVQAKHC